MTLLHIEEQTVPEIVTVQPDQRPGCFRDEIAKHPNPMFGQMLAELGRMTDGESRVILRLTWLRPPFTGLGVSVSSKPAATARSMERCRATAAIE